jgi:DNA-binding NtrC family response regulator
MNLVQIADDDPAVLESLGDAMRKEGYTPRLARTPEECLRQLETAEPAVAILDVRFSSGAIDGEELLRKINARSPDTQCIMVSGESDIRKALACMAEGSTLFIDEIGDFEHGLQAKFLRVLQEKTVMPVGATEETAVDVRTLFATHVDLEKSMEEGRFRRDLYFRISTFTLMLPPLRDRLEDIDVLAPFFVDKFLAENGLPSKEISRTALDKLKEHAYPGNIRELAQILKNSAFFNEGDILTADDIELRGTAGGDGFWESLRKTPWDQAKAVFERELLRRRVREAHGNVAKAAESLGIIKNNLYRKLREHGLGWGEDAAA